MSAFTRVRSFAPVAGLVCLATAPLALAENPGEALARSLFRPFDQMTWKKQAPDLPLMISELWGDHARDGGYGELVQVPPGFDSGLHAHSGDFHGVVVKGMWVHVDESGQGADAPLPPGSYIRQAGGGMHIDRCISKEPCVLFHFQYARADVLWPTDKK